MTVLFSRIKQECWTGKIWDPNSLGIDEFDALDYIEIMGDVTSFAGAMQVNIKRVRKAGEGGIRSGGLSSCQREQRG